MDARSKKMIGAGTNKWHQKFMQVKALFRARNSTKYFYCDQVDGLQ